MPVQVGPISTYVFSFILYNQTDYLPSYIPHENQQDDTHNPTKQRPRNANNRLRTVESDELDVRITSLQRHQSWLPLLRRRLRYLSPSSPSYLFNPPLTTSTILSPIDYGNEKEAGQGIARAIKDKLVQRSDLFIVTKLWNTFHDPQHVEPICRKQLSDWGVEYFDLYMMHFPVALKYVDTETRYPPGWSDDEGKLEFSNASIQQTWTAMETLVDKGLARSIGVSNFSAQLLMDLLRYARIRPATLQIEHHPYLTQERLVEYAQREGVAVTAYSSFGPSGFLELGLERAQDVPVLMDNPVVEAIAEKHGKTPAQVLLRWATQRGVAVIPKSNHPQRLVQNLDVTGGWDLEMGEIQAISGLDRGLRFNDPIAVS